MESQLSEWLHSDDTEWLTAEAVWAFIEIFHKIIQRIQKKKKSKKRVSMGPTWALWTPDSFTSEAFDYLLTLRNDANDID